MEGKRLQVVLPEITHEKIEEMRKKYGFTKSALIIFAVNELYENRKGRVMERAKDILKGERYERED